MRHLRRAKYRDETILTWQMAQICLSVFVKEFILSFFLTVAHEVDMEVIKRLLYRYSASEHKMHYELQRLAPYKIAVTGFKKQDLV